LPKFLVFQQPAGDRTGIRCIGDRSDDVLTGPITWSAHGRRSANVNDRAFGLVGVDWS
jgi:hypothetical protein